MNRTPTNYCNASERQDSTSDSGDDEEEQGDMFFDANCEPENIRQFDMDLETALAEAKLAIHYFFNNKFDEARLLLKPFANTSMYHSMGHSVFAFLEAVLTFEHCHIDKAGEELKRCLELCQRQRKKSTFTATLGKKIRRGNYSQMTDLEAHAELCAAEAMLLKALLTFIEDETLSSLIRGSIKIRQCYSSYKDCAHILEQRRWESKTSKIHFESGVRMGIGTFNLMVSQLPTGIIKVLEFIGFSGNKASGLADLKAGYQLDGIRQVLCAMTLLGYNLIVCYVLGHQEGDLSLCRDILSVQLEQYPEGVWFLFFKGRLEFMQGNLEEASRWYIKSWQSQQVWPQFHHLSFWELLWVECLRQNWHQANVYATYLVEKSNWSRTIYSYQKAAVMLMLNDGNGDDETSTADHAEIDRLLHDAPLYKQRIAGKSLPMEKFVLKKVDRYFAQERRLCLPAFELMYLWNTFKVFRKNYEAADRVLQILDKKLSSLPTTKSDPSIHNDNRALCLLLRGACYRQIKKPALALQDLNECVSMHKILKEDLYLVPYANVEAALVHADEQHTQLAVRRLEETKKKYTGFSLESRLHFRIHAALMELKATQ